MIQIQKARKGAYHLSIIIVIRFPVLVCWKPSTEGEIMLFFPRLEQQEA